MMGGLFTLRIPLTLWATMLYKPADQWARPVMAIGTYFLTALLIWWEREQLEYFHITKLALGIMILGKPIEILLYYLKIPYTNSDLSPIYLLYLPISIALGIAIFLYQPRRQNRVKISWTWIVISITIGLALAVVSSLLIKTPNPPGKLIVFPSLSVWLLGPIQQMSYAGITEEPFFRGFLWGSLRKAGWNEGWIWLFQVALFQIAHLYFIQLAPISFWISIPLGGLVLGYVAWRSRSIAYSILAHGIGNGIGNILDNLV